MHCEFALRAELLGHQFAQMPINCITQASEILPPIDMTGFQLIRKVRSGTPQG